MFPTRVGKTCSFLLNREVFGRKMHRLWMYVFCSVVVRPSLDVLTSLGHVIKPEGLLPSNETICNGTRQSFRLSPISAIKNTVWNPIANTAGKVTSVVIPNSNEHVCYKAVGCFQMGSPWKTILRPIGEPVNPEKIKASVNFFSRENTTPKSIYLYPEINLKGISFKANRTTVFIVHGFTSTGNATWVQNLTAAYLKVKDANLFCVNWEEGARGMNYLQVAANTRVVGKELALLIDKLIRHHEARAEDFHLIGHSLGAHICSYAAKEIPGIGHLTALDPAQPGFEGFSEKVRLDKGDARFVEVLHTDARPFVPTLGFGMITSHGHVDFYFNGFYQPGCLLPKTNIKIDSLQSLAKIPVEILSQIISCAHIRAYEYYTEAIAADKCAFWGRKIKLWNSFDMIVGAKESLFKARSSSKCTPDTCIPLGLSVKETPLRGIFLVITKTSAPYCTG